MTPGPHKLHFLLHSADLIDERLRVQLAPLGIRPRQARIIAALSRMGAVSQVELAREFGVTAASMSTMTTRLIAAGFITRKSKPGEGRANILCLTDKGRALVDDIHAAWRAVDAAIETILGPDRAAEMADLTRALRDGLGGRVPGMKPGRD